MDRIIFCYLRIVVVNFAVYQFIRIGIFLLSRKENNTFILILDYFVELSILILEVLGMNVYK